MEFLSQKELAERWRVSETKVKVLRQKQLIPYFEIPDSNRVLYPVKGIIEYEQSKIKGGGKVQLIKKHLSAPSKKWRAEL